jgi:hypothetical protein
VDGQIYYNTTTDDWWGYEGDWFKLCDAATYGGMLPLTAGSGYQLSNDLYFVGATKNIKNLKAASAATDAANKQDVIDYTDAHDHEGGTGEGQKIHILNATDSTGTTDWTLVEVGESDAVTNRHLGYAVAASQSVNDSTWTSVASTSSTWTHSNEPRYILFGTVHGADTNFQWRVRRDTTDITTGTTVTAERYMVRYMAYDDTVSSGANFDYKLEVYQTSGGATTFYQNFVYVF